MGLGSVALSAGPSVEAYPICVGAGYQSSVIGDRNIGPVCEGYNGAVECNIGTDGLSPTLVITNEECVPAPVINGTRTGG
jgi:hypothetical protein